MESLDFNISDLKVVNTSYCLKPQKKTQNSLVVFIYICLIDWSCIENYETNWWISGLEIKNDTPSLVQNVSCSQSSLSMNINDLLIISSANEFRVPHLNKPSEDKKNSRFSYQISFSRHNNIPRSVSSKIICCGIPICVSPGVCFYRLIKKIRIYDVT